MSMDHIKLFIIAGFIFFITDMIWIGYIARNLYFHHYEPWLRLVNGQLQPVWWATLMVYLCFALSVVVFIAPLADNSPLWAAVYGALLGAVIYGIYDFTCIAIFKDFPVMMGLLDWMWGTFLCAWSSCASIYLVSLFK